MNKNDSEAFDRLESYLKAKLKNENDRFDIEQLILLLHKEINESGNASRVARANLLKLKVGIGDALSHESLIYCPQLVTDACQLVLIGFSHRSE